MHRRIILMAIMYTNSRSKTVKILSATSLSTTPRKKTLKFFLCPRGKRGGFRERERTANTALSTLAGRNGDSRLAFRGCQAVVTAGNADAKSFVAFGNSHIAPRDEYRLGKELAGIEGECPYQRRRGNCHCPG
jgi:hypothetical protein